MRSGLLAALAWLAAALSPAAAAELTYGCSKPPLEVTFAVDNQHYSGAVTCGNLFLQTDIPTAPLVKWRGAKPGKLYTLLMLDYDGNANGSAPDAVPVGEATVRFSSAFATASGSALPAFSMAAFSAISAS